MLALPPETPFWVILVVAVVPPMCIAVVRALRASLPQDSRDRVMWWADRRKHRVQAKAARWRRRQQDQEDRRAFRLRRLELRNGGRQETAAERQPEPQHDE